MSDSFPPSTSQSTDYKRTEYWRSTPVGAHRIANICEQYREFPRQNENVQVRIMGDKTAQKLPEWTGALGRIVFEDLRPGIQIPGEQRDRFLCSPHGLHKCPIVARVHHFALLVDVSNYYAPAIVTWSENTGHALFPASFRP